MRRREYGVVLLMIALLAGVWLLAGRMQDTAGESGASFTITALPVGKADALIVEADGYAALIDTGEEEDGEDLVQALSERGIDTLSLLLVTHFDKDHVGSASYIMEHMDVATVMMPDYAGDRPEYEAFLKSLEGHPDVRRLTETEDYALGSAAFTVYPAEDAETIISEEDEYDNDLSLVARISYGENRFLLTGDIEKTRIRQMLASDTDWSSDWIKMPHHGRYQKALKELLDAVQPSYALICCSEDEPAEDKTTELLEERGIPVWDTSEQAVVTTSDGHEISVK